MHIKHGSILLAFFISVLSYAQPHLSVKLTTTSGNPLENPELGVPCLLHVTVHESSSVPEKPLFTTGADVTATFQHMQSSMSVTNGVAKSEYVFVYSVLVDREGTVGIGPFEVRTRDGRLSHPLVNYTVSYRQPSSHMQLTWHVAKERCYVGEPVEYIVRWFAPHSHAFLEELILPQIDGVTFHHTVQPVQTTAHKNGKSVQCVEWKGTMVVSNVGDAVIRAARLVYTQEERADRFFAFFTTRVARDTYSNALRVHVMQLPPYHVPAWALGVVQACELTCDRDELAVGSAGTITLGITGTGNFDLVAHPPLVLPDGLRSYPGKKITKDGTTTVFEYIVHAVQPGNFTVPEQKFVVFNTETEEYEVVTTESCNLIVTGQVQSFTEELQESSATKMDDVPPLVFSKIRMTRLPLWLFICVWLMPALLFFFWFVRRWCIRREQVRGYPWARKRALKKAYRRLSVAEKVSDVTRIYAIFEELAVRMQAYELCSAQTYDEYGGYPFVWFDQYPIIHYPSITAEQAAQACFSSCGLSDEQLLEFKHFWNYIGQCAFAPTACTFEEKKQLFAQAKKWLALLLSASGKTCYVLCSIALITVCMFTRATEDDVVKKIISLRCAQNVATYTRLYAYEDAVRALKNDVGAHYYPREQGVYLFVRDATALVPIIIWQLLALLVWLLFFLSVYGSIVGIRWCRALLIPFGIISFVLMFVVISDYQRHAYRWSIVAKPEGALVYLGPDEDYPQSHPLGYLAEVKVQKAVGQWLYIQSDQSAGWVTEQSLVSMLGCLEELTE